MLVLDFLRIEVVSFNEFHAYRLHAQCPITPVSQIRGGGGGAQLQTVT